MSVSEGILNKCGKISFIGALFILNAPFLPAIYTIYSTAPRTDEYRWLFVLWFFGFCLNIRVWNNPQGLPIQLSVYPGMFFIPLGLFVGSMILIMGIITLIKSTQIKKEKIDYKKGGIILLGGGIASVISLSIWILNISRFYNTGPAVYLGAIGSIIVIICGILIIIYSR